MYADTPYADTSYASFVEEEATLAYGNLGPSRERKKRKSAPVSQSLRKQLEDSYKKLVAKPTATARPVDPAPSPAPEPLLDLVPVRVLTQSELAEVAQMASSSAPASAPVRTAPDRVEATPAEVAALLQEIEELERQRKLAKQRLQRSLLLG